MRKLIFILVLTAGSFTLKAQDTRLIKFSVGLESAFPLGYFAEENSFGIGGSAQADFCVGKKLALTINTGYLSFLGKTIDGYKYESSRFIPLLAGIKYDLTEHLYASAQLGATFNNYEGTLYTYAPGLGYRLSEDFDVIFKYIGYTDLFWSGLSSLGIRIAYTF